jgi:hypothetical protein
MAHPQLLAITNTAVLISKVPCRVKAIYAFNAANASGFLQLFNTNAAANVTLGTTGPDGSYGAATLNPIYPDLGEGLDFPGGLVAACTTTYNGAAALSTSMIVNFVIGP